MTMDQDHKHTLSTEAQQRMFYALGEGVAKLWSGLPQDIQHQLFEAAVLAEGETARSQIAVFLHDTHARTTDALKARAIPEPDSKGG
jgi:hypothetical protein